MNKFDYLETLARRLIEGPFNRLFQTRLHPADLGHRLARAIERGRRNGANGQSHLIPNRYRIVLNPADYSSLMAESGDTDALTILHDYLAGIIAEGDYELTGPLQISLIENEVVEPGQVEIETDYVSAAQM